MIIHSPIISGSLTFAQGATMVSSDSGVSGSFSGSFQGDGSQLRNVAASGFNINLLSEGPITGDDYILFADASDSDTEKIATFKSALDSEGVFSGSAQVQGEVGGDLIPDTHNAYDLGSTTKYWRDLYLSSGSLYINGQQVLSTDGTELRITTDAGESIKILEAGNDTITLETEDGDITITTSGTGNIELDAPVQIAAGNQVLSSDGNAILFGEDIDAQSNRISANNIGNVAGTSTFTGSFVGDGTSLSGVNLYTDADTTSHLNSLAVVSGSATQVRTFINVEDGATADQTGAEIKTALFNESDTNNLTDTLLSKLNGIEATADITDTDNVTAAGALMDSEVTNLAQVKAFDSSDYATAAQGTLADSAQQPPSEGAFENGDKTKLDGIEANADVTDTANVKTALNASLGGAQTIGDSSDTITIAGNLTVSGTTTTVNSNTVNIGDNIIVLNSDESGTPSQNGGIEIERGSSDNVVFQFNEGTDRWQFTNDGSTYFNLPTSTVDITENTNLYYTDARVKTKLDAETVISGSSQVVLQSADKTGFTGASSITTLGTVTAGNVTQILPSGVVSGSDQVQALGGVNDNTITFTAGAGLNGGGSITLNQGSDETITFTVADGVVSGSDQLQDLGALMDSEVTDLDGIKSLTVPNDTTISTFGASLVDDADAGTARTTLGLGNVDNESKATMFDSPTFTGTVSGVSKSHVGLGNVDNTSDANKPVSTATQTALDLKANLDSPALTGNPTAPTQTGTDDSTKIATTAFVQDRIDAIIGTAGSTLDTLGELSASLSDDEDALTALTTTVGGKLQKDQNLSDLTNASTARVNIGLGNVTNESKSTMFASPTFTGTVSGVTADHVGLGNVDNESKATMFASPTFTGTVSGVSKSHVGLGNVDNTSDANKPVSTATQTALDLKAPLASPTFTGTVSGVTKSHVGLGNVDNTSDANKPVSTATQTALDLKAPLASPTFTGTVSGVSKSHVGLGNVDNTSDANKPVSTATQTALDLKAPLASPALTGNPTAPTQTGTDDSTKIATTAFVQDRIDTIIGTAGSTLDTLGELSASLADDQDALTSLTTTVGGKLQKDQNLSDLTNAETARTNLNVDVAGTDNSTNVTLAGSYDYLSITGQAITLGQVDAATDISNLTTSNVSEGSNEYFTNTRARASISVTDNGGDGSLGYSSGTGVITYTGPSAAETRAHFSGGTGVTITDGQVAIGQSVGTSDTVEFGIVSASTDLYFEGNLIGSSTSTGSFGRLEVNASTIKIGNQEIGETQAETLNNASGTNTGDVTLVGSYDYLSISGQAITLGQVDAATDISNLTTSNVSEGSNEYFTDARAQSALSSHTDSTSNPHSVTATQLGLGNVTNESKATMFASPTFTGTVSGVSKSHVGLGNVTNESKATMFASPTFTGTVSGVSKSHVGLGNVDNTSDANKPVSTATQTALDLKAPLASPTFTGTVSGVTADHVGLGNVTNESKATMFASPTFTGTVSGVTKSHVGLGNVTNESKATMFDSPAFTGNPTAPTQTGTDDSTKIATTAFVQDRIQAVVDTAPAALDTLNELAAAIGDDANFAGTVTTALGEKLVKASNLSDLTNAATARTNLGLGSMATLSSIDISSHTNLAVSDTTGQTGINMTLSGDTISGTVSGLTTTSTVQFGKVGVGGSSDATYELKVTGDIGATGDIVAFVSSDERLKNNIQLISNPIEKVKELRGVTWEWNEEASEAAKQTPNVGVIAQEVEKVLPELVHDRENGYKGVDYSKLTGLLIEVVKTQQEKIEILESRLDKLEK